MRDTPKTIKEAQAVLDATRPELSKVKEAIERLEGLQEDEATWLDGHLLTASVDEVALVMSRRDAIAIMLEAHRAEAKRLEEAVKQAANDLGNLQTQQARLEGSVKALQDRNAPLRLSPVERSKMLKRDSARLAALTAL